MSEIGRCYRSLALLSLALTALFFAGACGKKAAPTLREYEKPVAPSSLRAIHREEKILLRWDYPAEKETAVADFIMLKSSGSEFKKLFHIEKSKRAYEDADFETGSNYRYKIVAQSTKGVYSDDSNIIDVTPLDVPRPPSGLSFSVTGDALILVWKAGEDGLLYNVYRGSEKGKYGMSPVNRGPVPDSSFTDGFTINKTVYYTVRSLRGGAIRDEGGPSEELVVDPSELVPPAPKNATYYAAPDRVFLSWDEAEDSWVTLFRIYRRTAGEDYRLIGETQIPVFVDREPALSKRDYRVHAVGPAREGPGTEMRGVKYTAPPE